MFSFTIAERLIQHWFKIYLIRNFLFQKSSRKFHFEILHSLNFQKSSWILFAENIIQKELIWIVGIQWKCVKIILSLLFSSKHFFCSQKSTPFCKFLVSPIQFPVHRNNQFSSTNDVRRRPRLLLLMLRKLNQGIISCVDNVVSTSLFKWFCWTQAV